MRKTIKKCIKQASAVSFALILTGYCTVSVSAETQAAIKNKNNIFAIEYNNIDNAISNNIIESNNSIIINDPILFINNTSFNHKIVYSNASITVLPDGTLIELGDASEIAADECIVEGSEKQIVRSLYDYEEIEEEIIPLYNEVSPYTVYVNTNKELVYSTPFSNKESIGTLSFADTTTVIGIRDDGYTAILYNDRVSYISSSSIQITFPEDVTYNTTWTGKVLSKSNGRVLGPLGYETYYNLPMGGCVYYMNTLGYYGKVWTRSDGVKMWDNYIMLAADLSIYPKGSIVETTLGYGIVVDTGSFVNNGSGVEFDIAVSW